jgi:hypothetical protein
VQDYKALEILVTKIQKQLAPDAEVLHNVKLPGRRSGTDVECLPQFSATRGALTSIGSATTNCVEP